MRLFLCCICVSQAQEREGAALEKIDSLTDRVTQAGENLRDLEQRDEDASEREQFNEDKVSFLKEQLKEMLAAAEDHERKIPPLERVIDQMTTEIRDWNGKVEEVRKEMEDMEMLVGGDLSDDEDDVKAGKKAAVPTTRETNVCQEPDEEPGEDDDERARNEERKRYDDHDDDDEEEEEDDDWYEH